MMPGQVSDESSIRASGWLHRRIARLRHITGFVTTYGDERDPRIGVFARFHHVRRVADVAKRLHRLAGPLDDRRVQLLAWAHDVNRWPFAHNSERGLFDQAVNVREYFSAAPDITERDVEDLVGIHKKDPSRISDEARIVLYADSLTGIVEDPLFAIAGLNVHPRFIPAEIEDLLGYSLRSGRWYDCCRTLATEFHGPHGIELDRFQRRLHDLFDELLAEFLLVHDIKSVDDVDGLFAIARRIKETFMRPIIFPLNNERVCHSTWLREEVFPWYLEHSGQDAGRLLEIDEREFVAEVTCLPGSPFEPRNFLPDLGVVRRELSDMAFIG